jgi:hypothetical protein
MPTVALRVTTLVVVLLWTVSCGGSATKPDPATKARVVAEANALCRQQARRSRPLAEQVQAAFQHRLAYLLRAITKAAANLPAATALERERTARRQLMRELSKRSAGGESVPPTVLMDRLYRVELLIHDDWKALGLTACLGPPPRPPISG